MKKYEVGDRVKYNHAFLKNTGSTFEIASMEGTIVEVKGNFANGLLVKIKWDGDTEIRGCLTSNLAKLTKESGLIDPTI
jgi:hypothetical protein